MIDVTPPLASVHPEELMVTTETVFIGFKQRQSVPSLALSIYLSVVNYSSWQENLTITTVKVFLNILISCRWFFALFQNVAKPVTELSFPSVTICSAGLNMEAVKEALLDDFNIWLKEESKTGGSNKDRFDEYMADKYASKVGDIMGTIKGLNSPPPSNREDSGNSAILDNLVSCGTKKIRPTKVNRKRRSSSQGNILILECNDERYYLQIV